jgi:hypothetical protein
LPEDYGDLKLRIPDEEDEATGADVPLSFRDLVDSLDARAAGGDLAIDDDGNLAIPDAGIAARMMKPTRGIVSASADLNVLGVTNLTDVPGTKKEIEVAVRSLIVVRAVFAFFAFDSHTPFGSGDFRGAPFIDGSTPGGGNIAYFRVDLASDDEVAVAQGFSTFEKVVEPGKRVLKLQAYGATGTEWDQQHIQASGTFYEYEVWAA